MTEHDLGIEERLRRKMARPARTKSIATRFTKDEAARIHAAAAQRGQTVREWSREVMLQAAGGTQTDQLLLTELVALQMLTTRALRAIATDEELMPKQTWEHLVNEVRNGKAAGAQEKLAEWSCRSNG